MFPLPHLYFPNLGKFAYVELKKFYTPAANVAFAVDDEDPFDCGVFGDLAKAFAASSGKLASTFIPHAPFLSSSVPPLAFMHVKLQQVITFARRNSIESSLSIGRRRFVLPMIF